MIEYAQSVLVNEEKIQAAWLIGSYARGDNDQYSDVDCCAYSEITADADQAFFNIQQLVARNPAIIFSKKLPLGRTLNIITQDWHRLDITIIDRLQIKNISFNESKFLFGEEKITPYLGQHHHSAPLNSQEIDSIVHEFIRVLGLLPVVIGRQDYVLGQTGAQLLRDMLIKLMLIENADGVVRGVLSIKKSLMPEQYKILQEIPSIAANKEYVIKTYQYIAMDFFACARLIYKTKNMVWPTRFEEATLQHLHQKIGWVL
ncbi:MAG: nucleotidyltransferase domain-containing protein [Alphaproteobacteria bacterium]